MNHLKYNGFISHQWGVKILGKKDDQDYEIEIDWPQFNHIKFIQERDHNKDES